ncbi:MAG: superoxide dismutase [Bacteroidetes bacterium]|nr:MAG: superoxide dismutase [Bacteroidota bacterium]
MKTGLSFENKKVVQAEDLFALPPLPYAYDALEPFIDKQTMEIHHTKHHQAYIDKLNKAVTDAKLNGITLEVLCKNVSKYPIAIRNHGGGHYNHSMFWNSMKPNPGSVLEPAKANEPVWKIGDAIKSTFDSFSNFKTKFTEKAMSTFGSGWAWLVINKEGKLEIGSTPNQDNPLMDLAEFKGTPIIGLDVWEHAYYLKYQNKRADYVNSWWNIVNWEVASKRFEGK